MKIYRLLSYIVATIAILVVIYTAYWFIVADQILDRISMWKVEGVSTNTHLETVVVKRSGYPFSINILMDNYKVTNSTSRWSLEGKGVEASFRPWNFNNINIRFIGQNSLQYFDGDNIQDIKMRIGDGSAAIHITNQDQIERLFVNFSNIDIANISSANSTRIDNLKLEVFSLPGEKPNQSNVSTVKLDLKEFSPPGDFAYEMGGLIESISFNIDVYRFSVFANQKISIAEWRDDGGIAEIKAFEMRWGPLGLKTIGTVSLDQEMRPIGALTADIIGYGDVIDALIMSNMIPLGDAFIAKVAFNMLAEKPVDGGPPVLRAIPVTIQDGQLFIDTVSFAKVSPLQF